MKIFVLNPVKTVMTNEYIARLKSLGDVVIDIDAKNILEVSGILNKKEDKIIALDPDFCRWSIDNKTIAKIPNLKAILLSTTSFDFIDIKYARKRGVVVTNLRGFSTEAVANYGLTMLLNIARKLPLVIKDEFKYEDYEKYRGIELKRKKVGIVGLGKIGTRFAELCQGIGMEVQYWSQRSRDERFLYTEIEELFKTSDVIYPIMAKNDESIRVITDNLLKTVKTSCIIISNTKSIYNHKLVIDLAEKEKIYGYGFEAHENDFYKYKGNIWAAPSLGWITQETFDRNAEMWFESIKDAIAGQFPNRVN